MKKISILATMLLGLFAFTACETDNDDNPTLAVPQSFQINNPVVGNQVVDLSPASSSIELKVHAAPAYGFPTAVSYGAQMSLDGNFTEADTYTLDGTTTSMTYQALTYDIEKGIQTLRGVEDENGFNTLITEAERTNGMPVYLRMTANLLNAQDSSSLVTSNVVKVNVLPYYYELKDADPEIWWMTGAIIADGSWSNSESALGTGMTPLYTKKGEEYDKVTGTGVLEYTGWFEAGSFKIIAPAGIGNWNYGMCGGTEEGGHVYRDGGDDPGDISITVAGYYTLTLDTKAHELKITPYTDPVSVFTTITLPGSHNEWDAAADALTGITTVAENHDWTTEVTFTKEEEVKFAIGNWDTNWGAATFPWGQGVGGGANIPATAGTYKVYFNDITGQYMFIAK
ncbi:MAG: SusF/SusE family outer membrane protein [Prevotella sp.]|nr:SusF/SusE family outer membrane protein [Prevotella sp.]